MTESCRWYERSFGELYPILYRHRDDTAAAQEITRLFKWLELPPPAVVLDLACGAGRHLETILAAGYDAWGVDLSSSLLTCALQRKTTAGRLVCADMRWLPFRSGFEVVVNLFTSFGYFEDNENYAVVQDCYAALKPGGRLVIDHLNRHRLVTELVPEDRYVIEELAVRQRRRIDGNRVRKEITVTDAAGQETTFLEDVRLYWEAELQDLFATVGFTDITCVGDFTGAEFQADSPRMIMVGRK